MFITEQTNTLRALTCYQLTPPLLPFHLGIRVAPKVGIIAVHLVPERTGSSVGAFTTKCLCLLPVGLEVLGQLVVVASGSKQGSNLAVLLAGSGSELEQSVGHIEGYKAKAAEAAHLAWNL